MLDNSMSFLHYLCLKQNIEEVPFLMLSKYFLMITFEIIVLKNGYLKL